MNPSDRATGLEPTVDCTVEPRGESANDRAEVSRPGVAFVQGSQPQFAHETARLVRTRLTAAALVLFVVSAFALVTNLAAPLILLRVLILVVLAASCGVLASRRPLALVQLRGIELGVFAAVVLQMLLMLHARFAAAAADGNTVAVVSAKQGYLAAWAVLLLVYAMLMPNSWRRAAAILLPTACVPYAWLWWLQMSDGAIARALAADNGFGLPVPIVAACVGVFGSHVIHAARREAFKARQLGQYVLRRRIGSGGMGEVYEAEHQLLKRPCAIKLIKPGEKIDVRALARFEREVQATARLTHWNTVEIFDYGHADDGTFYYAMELLPGLNFEDLVKLYGLVPAERAVHLLLQACHALGEAHAKGLIHRDIKPANLFASERGGVYDVVKLLDFGLVLERGPETNIHLTQPGTFSGSPLYMCPEQATCYDRLDARSDIYSLGAVAYWLVTGQPPFNGDTVWEIITAHSRDPIRPPRDLNPAIPEDLELILIRCLAKMPANRFQSVVELAQALAACQCAGKWTDRRAAEWWQALADAPQPSKDDASRTHPTNPDYRSFAP
jgi:serine/threonine-protein kinase